MTNFETLTPEIIAEYWSENISEVDQFSIIHCPYSCPAYEFCRKNNLRTCNENFLLWLKSESKN